MAVANFKFKQMPHTNGPKKEFLVRAPMDVASQLLKIQQETHETFNSIINKILRTHLKLKLPKDKKK